MLEPARQLIRFAGAGSVSALGHFGTLILLVQAFGIAAVPASAAGALVGAWINYILNYRYTFHSSKQHREALLKFAVVAVIGLLLNTLLMWLGVEIFEQHYLLSQLLTTGLVFIWSFLANRWWTFHVIPSRPSQ
ncbi:MAG: GtrA family protein [Sterolibacterium sp.]